MFRLTAAFVMWHYIQHLVLLSGRRFLQLLVVWVHPSRSDHSLKCYYMADTCHLPCTHALHCLTANSPPFPSLLSSRPFAVRYLKSSYRLLPACHCWCGACVLTLLAARWSHWSKADWWPMSVVMFMYDVKQFDRQTLMLTCCMLRPVTSDHTPRHCHSNELTRLVSAEFCQNHTTSMRSHASSRPYWPSFNTCNSP
jgi:hypothetical protein